MIGDFAVSALPLRKAYKQALDNNVVGYSANSVPVYDFVFDGKNFPYVVLGAHNSTTTDNGNLGTKQDWMEQVRLSVHVFTGSSGQFRSSKEGHEIMRQVVSNACEGRGKNLDLGANHQLFYAVLDNYENSIEEWKTGRVHRFTAEFLHLISYEP